MEKNKNTPTEIDLYNYGYHGSDYNHSYKGIWSYISETTNTKDKNIFLRGIFDGLGNGNICEENYLIKLVCCFGELVDYIPTAFSIEDNIIIIQGFNAYEFLHTIYENANYYKKENYETYLKLFNKNLTESPKYFKYLKTNEKAITPSKSRITDSGFDLFIVEKLSQKGNLYMYDTCIIVQPDPGIYFDLVPRSSIIKKGYILANSIGIIDQTFTGSIKVALIKIAQDAEELELPLKLVQIIPRQVIQMNGIEIKTKTDLISTIRGEGEYGSTDKK